MAISGGDAILGRAAILLGAEIDPKFASEAEKGILGPLQKIAHHATAILVGAFAVHKMIDFFKESTKAAIENERSVAVLATTMKNLGLGEATEGVEKFIKKLSEERGIIEDALRPAFSRLVRFTQDATEAEKLLSLAQDISAGTGKGLIIVSTALGKAHDGNVSGLARLGVKIKDEQNNTLSYTKIVEQLERQFKGLGAQVAEIDPWQKFGVAVHELQVQVGELLLPVLRQIGRVLTADVVPAIRSVIGFLGDLNGLTDGWGGKILATIAGLTALAFTIKTLVAVGGALRLFMATTISQLGTGAAVAASYAGGLLGTAAANTTAGGAAAGAATAFGTEQLSLFGTVPAAEASQLSLFALVPAEKAAAAGAVELGVAANTAKVGLIGVLGPLALLVTGGVLLGRTLDRMFPEGDNPVSNAVKEIIKDMQSFSTEAFRAELQKAADRLHDLGFDPFERLGKDLDEILKKTPQFAQQFLDVAKSLRGGEEGTRGWQERIDQTVESIRKVNESGDAWQKQISGTTDEIDGQTDALAELEGQTGAAAIAMIEAVAAGDAIRESMERGKKANEDAAQAAVDHADAYAVLVDAIGPVAAKITTTASTTTDQLSQMAEDASQFAADFASALHTATDSISFFGNETVVTADQLREFLVKSLAATNAWTANLQYAIAIGIDKGYLQELAKAGPKAAPILQALLDLVTKTSVSATNQLLTGVSNAQSISRNLWNGFVADAAQAARRLSIELHDVQVQTRSAFSGVTAGTPLKPPPLLAFPTPESLGLGKAGGVGGAGTASAIDTAIDAVAESLKRLQDQFKIGEITEQQLADQAGAMWADTEKFSSNWMAIWDILHSNALHLQETADASAKAATDAADQAAKAAQEAADKAAKAAADAAEKVAEAAAKAAAEYADAFDEIVAVLGKYGAAAVKARGLTADQLKAMASDIRSFQSAVASSFASASNAIAAFGNDVEVTGQQLLDFQRQSLEDARDWSVNITRLMQMGLDASLLRPLAEAGPKAGALVKAYLDEIGLVGVNAVNQIARDQARVLAQTTATLTGGIAWGPTQQTQPQPSQVVNSMFTVQGSVYGVDDLNAYMDQRDAILAAAIGAGQR